MHRPALLATLRRRSARTALALVAAATVTDVHFWSALQGADYLASAHAQTAVNSTLALLVVPVAKKADGDAEALERMLSEAAARLDTVKPFELSPLPGLEAEEQAAVIIEDALRALLLRTPKRAQERLQAAIGKLKDAPMAGDERLYARLFKAQALALLAVGELVPARDTLVKSLVLMPGQTEEEYSAYGSQAKDLYTQVAASVNGGAKGDVKVVVRGGRADIWIDGIWRGAGTAQAANLPAGSHRVTVRMGGMVAERRFVDVAAGKPGIAEFDLKPAPFGPDLEQGRAVLATNFKQPSVVEDRMRELRNQLGADQMIVVRPAADGKKSTTLAGYFLGADGSFRKLEDAIDKDEKYFDRLGTFLAEATGAKLGADPGAQPLDLRQSVVTQGAGRKAGSEQIDPNAPLFDEGKDKKKPITSEWWFWTAVIGGASLIGGGLYLLTSGDESGSTDAVGKVEVKLNKVATP